MFQIETDNLVIVTFLIGQPLVSIDNLCCVDLDMMQYRHTNTDFFEEKKT